MSAHARTTLAALTTLGLLLVTPTILSAAGTADGKIVVNGKTSVLKYAYATAGPGFFDKTKEDVTVILSDVPLEGKALDDPFERIHMADAGKLNAFEITIGSDGKPNSTSFRSNAFKKAAPSGLSSEDVFEKKTFDGKMVEGRYKSAKTHEFFGDTYSFDVGFKADITRKAKPVPPSAADTAAAASSPEAKAYADYLKALQGEDLEGLRKMFTKEQAKHLDDPDAKKMIGLVKMMSATDVKVLKVDEKGDKADLTVTGKQDGRAANGVVHMVKEGGAWKLEREEWKD
jgi:hypothetical protein